MRIGIFTETYPPFINGVSTSILMLQKALERKGHIVYIVTVSEENLKYEYDEENRILRLPSLSLHVYDYKLTGIYNIKAIKTIKEMNLDIIHTHVEFTIGLFARIVSTQLSIPLVHTYHTLWEDYTHYITHGKRILDIPSKEIVKYLSRFFGDKTTTELIVPTKKIYNLFKDKYKVRKNIHIIPTGIEVERFYKELYDPKEIDSLRKKYKISKKDFVVLTVGRLAKEKNFEETIMYHSKLIKKKNNIKLVIVGDGPERENLEKLVDSLKINKSVIFVGRVLLEDMPKYYQLANIYTSASKSETQGLTVIEAMASSLPIVATYDDSYIESVVDDLNGYLYNNEEEYINYILKIYNDKGLRERFSNQSRILSESKSSKYFAERVISVYEQAIKNYKKENKKIINRLKKIVIKGRSNKWKK